MCKIIRFALFYLLALGTLYLAASGTSDMITQSHTPADTGRWWKTVVLYDLSAIAYVGYALWLCHGKKQTWRALGCWTMTFIGIMPLIGCLAMWIFPDGKTDNISLYLWTYLPLSLWCGFCWWGLHKEKPLLSKWGIYAALGFIVAIVWWSWRAGILN